MVRVAHRHVPCRVEHALVCQDAAGDRELLEYRYFHGITDTWIAPGAPSPPTDLIA